MPKSIHTLVAFQRAVDLAVDVYAVTSSFPRSELYGLTAQMRRSATSVPSNIAEGQGRLTFGEWRQFLSQARGSLFEVEAQTVIAERLEFLMPEETSRIRKRIREAGKALSGLIEWVREQERKTKQPSNSATKQPPTAKNQSAPPYPPPPAPKTRLPAT